MSIDQTSQISSNGMGYSTNEGFGCVDIQIKLQDQQQCGGTGGRHGGIRRFSISPKTNYNYLCLQLLSKQIYDYSFNLVLQGSDGSGVTYSDFFKNSKLEGQGGGVIHLEVLLNLQNNGTISSDGTQEIEQPFLGSGIGGSIQLRLIYFSGKGLVFADGGSFNYVVDLNQHKFAQSKFYQVYQLYGGFGGGGRIRLFFFNITEMIISDYNYGFTNSSIQTNSGGMSIQQKSFLNISNQNFMKQNMVNIVNYNLFGEFKSCLEKSQIIQLYKQNGILFIPQ